MKKIIYSLLLCTLIACNSTSNRTKVEQQPPIFPDYTEVTMPHNIAPPSFTVKGAEKVMAEFYFNNQLYFTARGDGYDGISISQKQWKKLLLDAKGKHISIVVCSRSEGEEQWKEYAPFSIHIASEAIDSYISYRLIKPGYELWDKMGIYQRNTTNYHERKLLHNDQLKGSDNGRGCVNCHSFCNHSGDTLMFHTRAVNAGTTIIKGVESQTFVNLKTEDIIGGAYCSWHPSGRYIAFAMCSTMQVFHVFDRNRISVYDSASDLMLYDTEKNEIITTSKLFATPEFETFPWWSPDGQWLYFSSAKAAGELPQHNDKMLYSICRIAFDQTSGTFGDSIEYIVDSEATHKSQLFARISPSNRYLLYTEANYGTFPIWHHEADLKMVDLTTMQPIDVSVLNSNSTESYHSWSSNGHWVVFSSRRIDGLYTRLFVAYFDGEGNFHKPFLLPQATASFDEERMQSYNIPEFSKTATSLSSRELEKRVKTTAQKPKVRHN